MTDLLSPQERSALMSRIRGSDTKPEMAVRRALHARGYRFRTHVRGLPGTPDIVFSRRRAAVFVHGCFWHRHGCNRTSVPKTRQDFWREKFAANVERDKRVQALLVRSGWRVFVAWECEVENDDVLFDRLFDFLGPPRFA
ncbi:MAG: very short patch repair endonuclease [Acidobacteria bacterium]|nr:very short patch repair endonuclease [Acidobacteriota bacterium]